MKNEISKLEENENLYKINRGHCRCYDISLVNYGKNKWSCEVDKNAG